MVMNNLNLDSMNEQQLWNFFRQEVTREECPEEYDLIFNGFNIRFEIVRYFGAEGITTVRDGTFVIISRPRRMYTREGFEEEVSMRMSMMKELLEEKFKKDPIAKTRALRQEVSP